MLDSTACGGDRPPLEGDVPASYVLLDRSRSSLDATVDAEPKFGAVSRPVTRLKLRVLVDHSALEIFANGKPLTARTDPAVPFEARRGSCGAFDRQPTAE